MPAAGHEDLARLVDPDLFDLRVVQPALQHSEAGDRVQNATSERVPVADRRQGGRERAVVVVGHDLLDDRPDAVRVTGRVQTAAPDQLAHLGLDDLCGRCHGCLRVSRRGPHPSALAPIAGPPEAVGTIMSRRA